VHSASLGRLDPNIVGKRYRVAEHWTMSCSCRRFKFWKYLDSPLVHAAPIWRRNGEAWEPSRQCCFREWWL